MKTFLKSTTALGMSLMLVLPSGSFARDLNPCRLDGTETLFPCMANGEVIRSLEDMNAVLERLGPVPDAQSDTIAVERGNADKAEQQALEAARAAEKAQVEAEKRAQMEAEAVRKAQAEEEKRAQQEAQAAARAAQARQARAEARLEARREAERAAAEAEAERQKEADFAARMEAHKAAVARAEADRAALRAQRQAERDAELAAAAAAAKAAESGQSTGEVVTEQVTEDVVRASNEEFDTSVSGNTAAARQDGDDGLSKFEKALLLGLGAVVVGSVLKNGDKVVSRSGDRVVVEDPNGDLRVLKDDDALIRRPGDQVATETFDDGSSRSIVTKPDGSQVITVRGRDGTVLRRVNVDPQGNQYVLFDDLRQTEEVVVTELPQVQQSAALVGAQNEAALRAALQAEQNAAFDRRFSLRQIRDIEQVRALAPELELDAVRFASGSAAIQPEQARSLTRIGTTLSRLVQEDPRTVILIEGHTDAVGDRTYNLALSDRRAETVALALTEYFNVPAENMITQGYGESSLKVLTPDAEPANRRAVVRNITALLR